MAISNPMLENLKMDGASKILINITGSDDLGMTEVQEIVKTITASANPHNDIFWGQVLDPSMDGKVLVTVIATGFNNSSVSSTMEDETETRSFIRDENVVDTNEFESIFHAKTFAPASEPEDRFFVSENKDEEETEKKPERSLGSDIFGGTFEGVKTSSSSITPPPNVNHSDISQPACWRNGNSYGRGINLSND